MYVGTVSAAKTVIRENVADEDQKDAEGNVSIVTGLEVWLSESQSVSVDEGDGVGTAVTVEVTVSVTKTNETDSEIEAEVGVGRGVTVVSDISICVTVTTSVEKSPESEVKLEVSIKYAEEVGVRDSDRIVLDSVVVVVSDSDTSCLLLSFTMA